MDATEVWNFKGLNHESTSSSLETRILPDLRPDEQDAAIYSLRTDFVK